MNSSVTQCDWVDEVPVVDFELLISDKPRFLSGFHHALKHVGFALLENVPGLEADFQQRCFDHAHDFFEQPAEYQDRFDSSLAPHFRGHSVGRKYADDLKPVISSYSFGFDYPAVENSDAPTWQRILRGPNMWPDEGPGGVESGFRETMEQLHNTYFQLSRQLGRVICDMLGVSDERYNAYFDQDDPDMVASINHYHPPEEIHGGRPELVKKVEADFSDAINYNIPGNGVHRDGGPFVTLLIGDSPGLQILSPHDNSTWMDAPVIPGTVIVNIGVTLMALTGGELVATTHRACPLKVERRRVSLPYFLLPRLQGDLVPFDEPMDLSLTPEERHKIRKRKDRTLSYTMERLTLYSQKQPPGGAEEVSNAVDRFYKDDFELAKRQTEEERRTYELVNHEK